MTIASEIQRIKDNIAGAYTACGEKGATLPAQQNSANLASCISAIPSSTPTIDSLTVTPTTTSQTITAGSGVDGYSPVKVNAVTSSIDSNITAANIKKDVTILGVTGSYEGSEIGIPREVDSQGKYGYPVSNFSFSLPSSATDMRKMAMYNAFSECYKLISVDLSSLTTLSGSYAMCSAFSVCTQLASVDLSNLVTISGDRALYHSFQSCALTSVDLSSLTTISGNSSMLNTFYGCTDLISVDLSSLTTISGDSSMEDTFYGCTSLTSVDLSNLTSLLGTRAMGSTFYGCTSLTSVNFASLATINAAIALCGTFNRCTSLTSLSFPALNSNSFGSFTNQFDRMLLGVTGCTVHFPSNLQSVIGSWTDVTAGFGGTDTVVLFDLPATE